MGDINVVARAQHIIVDTPTNSVAVVSVGPPGPAGPPGVGGTAAGTLVVDNADWFLGDNVELILEEIGQSLQDRDTAIADHEARLGVNEVKISDNDLRLSTVEGVASGNTSEIASEIARIEGIVSTGDSTLADGITQNTGDIASNLSAINQLVIDLSEKLSLTGGNMTGALSVINIDQASDPGQAVPLSYVQQALTDFQNSFSQLASAITTEDNNDYFVGSSVEDALQEIGAALVTINARLDALENP